ncbi:Uma2 family endonuclease [Streptomyces mayteni]
MTESVEDLERILTQLPIPEGFVAEIEDGRIILSPQREQHNRISRMVVRAFVERYGWDRPALEDVRLNFPGKEIGYAPDVAIPKQEARRAENDKFDAEDLDFIAEVVSPDSRTADYGVKSDAYAAEGIPAYLIVDDAKGLCELRENPREGRYFFTRQFKFGDMISIVAGDTAFDIDTSTFERP